MFSLNQEWDCIEIKMQHDDIIDFQCSYSQWATLSQLTVGLLLRKGFRLWSLSNNCTKDFTQKRTQICQYMRRLEVLLQLPLPGAFPKKLHSPELLHLRESYLWVFPWMFQGCFEHQTEFLPCFQCKWRQNKWVSSYTSYDFTVLNGSQVNRQGKGDFI